MDIDAYLQTLRAALFARGIFGRRAIRLTEELRDHHASKKDELLAEDHIDADALALAALGKPEVVADSALASLQGSSWLARHPYLAGLCFGFLIFVVNIVLAFLILASVSLLVDLSENPAGPHALLGMKSVVIMLNWLPSLVGVILLFWLARRYASGWKPFLAAGVALAITISLIGVCKLIEPRLVAAPAMPQEQREHYSVILECSPLAIAVAMCTREPDWRDLLSYVDPDAYFLLFVRLLMLMSVCFGFKILVPRLRYRPPAALGDKF